MTVVVIGQRRDPPVRGADYEPTASAVEPVGGADQLGHLVVVVSRSLARR